MHIRKMVKWSCELPDWAEWGEDEQGNLRIDVDPDIVFPKFLGIMKQVKPELDIENPTRQMIQIATWLVQRRLKKLMYADGNDFLRLHILRRPAWRLVNFPNGEYINKRSIYKKLGLDKVRPEKETIEVDW